MTFEHVLVVGAGQMGGGIAQVVAASGRRVSLHDPFPGAVERGLGTIRRSLERLAEKGGADPDETLGRVWGMLLGTQGRDTVVTHLLVEGGAFERDTLLPFQLVGWSSDSLLGMSSYAWRVKHNVAHHTYTNVDGYDADATQVPLARFMPSQGARPRECR